MPLQGMVTFNAVRRTSQYVGVAETQKVAFNPIGQVVGQINEVQSCRDVVFELLSGYVDSTERLSSLLPQD